MTFIFPRAHLSGLTISMAGSSPSFSVSAGQAADSSNSAIVNLPAALSKTAAIWAAGSGGGLDTGTIAVNTWYHAFLIASADGSLADIVVSTSLTSPVLPVGYALFRRIGAMRTDGSGNWIKFQQLGDEFIWDAGVLDFNSSGVASRALYALTVPPGVRVSSQVVIFVNGASPGSATSVACPDIVGPGGSQVIQNSSSQGLAALTVRTNTSQQIAITQGAAGPLSIWTLGWTDRRGKDD
ncbi:hypothetical protein [Bradyrhizobium denitrificans]|jgi:hypothetical protein|uniref:hypothetical protein n=1 Tax=Bradyrhizobium denitrificans TaxID=2734912 RepID=UPI001556CEDD|nr:hypothetical protein [Bradyrhizobium sp. LMG 8443]NPU23926.1 hypothetical protein [Bradyrhizobium sp. LMG 8443]